MPKIIFILILLSTVTHGDAQNVLEVAQTSDMNVPQIKWIKQWPDQSQKHYSQSFTSRFKAIFLGKKELIPARPISIAAFDSGNFWILDQGFKSVCEVNGMVGDIPHFIGKRNLEFFSIVAMCMTPYNGILFTDSGSDRVYQILPEKRSISLLVDSAFLNQPTGIAYSPVSDDIWVVETNAHHISVFSKDGKFIKHVGSRGKGRGEFNYPTHLWIDKTGLVYIVDAMNFRIQVMDITGEVVSVFGQQGDASGYLARPKGIATDSHRNIYIVDGLFHAVQVFDLKGNYLFAFGRQGNGPGEFCMPNGIFIDDKDFIYIADSYNSRIQVFQIVYGL